MRILAFDTAAAQPVAEYFYRLDGRAWTKSAMRWRCLTARSW